MSQNFTLTVWPLTITSFVLGNFISEYELFIQSEDLILLSSSGGLEFLGTIPGLLEDVKNRKFKSYMIAVVG